MAGTKLLLGLALVFKVALAATGDVALGLYCDHDANAALTIGGEVVGVIELERMTGERYYNPSPGRVVSAEFDTVWSDAVRLLTSMANVSHVDVAVIVTWKVNSDIIRKLVPNSASEDAKALVVEQDLRRVVESVVSVSQWMVRDHHLSHAAAGFYASPFRHALVISYDAAGNDGVFEVFVGQREPGWGGQGSLIRRESLELRLGGLYNVVGKHLNEVVSRNATDPRRACTDTMPNFQLNKATGCLSGDEAATLPTFSCTSAKCGLSVAGKLMGYAGTAKANNDFIPTFEHYFRQPITKDGCTNFLIQDDVYAGQGQQRHARTDSIMTDFIPAGFERQRIYAASMQAAFENVLLSEVKRLTAEATQRGDNIDGIVLSGGCALNVPANWGVATATNLPVFVPPAPNDSGLSLGAAWLVRPPLFLEKATRRIANTLQYAGPELFDRNDLAAAVRQRGAWRVTPSEVGSLLREGAIIGLVRGRSEFGPRALGHRSLLARANDRNMLKRLNRLKRRQWYRPVAPMIAQEDAAKCFGDQWASNDASSSGALSPDHSSDRGLSLESPYMELAAPLTPWCRDTFPAIAHFDGTARPQTLTAAQEPWLHALLSEIRRAHGAGILINTSLNVKGRPILNTLQQVFELLDNPAYSDLDAVVVDDWLFERPPSSVATSDDSLTPGPDKEQSATPDLGTCQEGYVTWECVAPLEARNEYSL